MLNRRHLRIKVLQTLYACRQSEPKDGAAYQKALLQSVDKVYEMYITILSLLIEVADYSATDAEERANKHLPTETDLKASNKLQHNQFIALLRKNQDYVDAVKKYKLSWSFDPEIAKSIFSALIKTDEYAAYLNDAKQVFETDKQVAKHLFKKVILTSAIARQYLEEKFINWPVDEEVVQAMIAKTFKNFGSKNPQQNKLAELLSNPADDREFITTLFAHSVAFKDEFQQLISKRTKNWEADRIALMDTLLMQMAITELVHFPSIPVKVTINEYIEISKEYSTPKSNSFINGILDKITADLKDMGKIRKTGRGLME